MRGHVGNQRRQQRTVTWIGEDTDNRVYELKDGEETPIDDWRGEKKPERTYVMKDGDNLTDCLASALTSSDDSNSETIAGIGSDSVLEESDTQPQQSSDLQDDHVIDPRNTYIGNVHSQQTPPKANPEWWTDAWDHRDGTAMSMTDAVKPVSPMEFRQEVFLDVFAFNQIGFQTENDSTRGETMSPNASNKLLGGMVGVLWNDHYITMTRYCSKGQSPDELSLEHFAQVVSLCPDGAILTFQAQSAWLVHEWDTMMQWKDMGYAEFDREKCAEPWSRIMHAWKGNTGGFRFQWEQATKCQYSRKRR
jgi:hypothetical protein